MISLFNKSSYRWSALSAALMIVLGAVLLTNPKALADSSYSSQGTIVKSNHFEQDVDKDIADSFNLSLKDFYKVNEEPLFDQQEDTYASTLLRVLFQVRENQGYGGINPSAYLKPDGKNGYILAKMADGTNYLYTIAYDQGWAIIKTITAQGKAVNIEKSNKTYSSLSEAQLQNYLKENSLSPLAVQNIGNYTVVLYTTEREKLSEQEKKAVPENVSKLIKAIDLSVDQDGNIINTGGGGGDDNSNIVPVSIGCENHESERGYIGFSRLIINDSNLLKNAYALKCCYKNDLTTTTLVNHHKAFIIPFPEKKAELLNVIVSDQDGKVLFDHNAWQKNTNHS